MWNRAVMVEGVKTTSRPAGPPQSGCTAMGTLGDSSPRSNVSRAVYLAYQFRHT